MIWYHELKLRIGDLTRLDQNVLHIFLGLILYTFATQILRLKPYYGWLFVLVLGVANELVDWLNVIELNRDYSFYGGAKDILLTVFGPCCLTVVHAIATARERKTKNPQY